MSLERPTKRLRVEVARPLTPEHRVFDEVPTTCPAHVRKSSRSQSRSTCSTEPPRELFLQALDDETEADDFFFAKSSLASSSSSLRTGQPFVLDAEDGRFYEPLSYHQLQQQQLPQSQLLQQPSSVQQWHNDDHDMYSYPSPQYSSYATSSQRVLQQPLPLPQLQTIQQHHQVGELWQQQAADFFRFIDGRPLHVVHH